jgi:hypothetical protein
MGWQRLRDGRLSRRREARTAAIARSATLTPEEVVRRLVTLEFDCFESN